MDLNPNHAERRVYHRCRASYIINGLPLYIIIAKEDMIYTFGDEIHAKA